MAVDFSRGRGSLEDIERARALAERQRARDAELEAKAAEAAPAVQRAEPEHATEGSRGHEGPSPETTSSGSTKQPETGTGKGRELMDSIARSAQAQRTKSKNDRQR